jgi:serine/threonine-protein kinase RsbW
MEKLFALTIPADINEIPRVSAALEDAMRIHAFGDEDILDTQLAVEESITNIIVHGYRHKQGDIEITCQATHGITEVRIADQAPPFDPLSIPEPDISLDINKRQIGGLGIFLIRQVMDDISYRYDGGKNILTLIKRKSA